MRRRTNKELASMIEASQAKGFGSSWLFFNNSTNSACATGLMLIADRKFNFSEAQNDFNALYNYLDELMGRRQGYFAAHLAMALLLKANILTILAVSYLHTMSVDGKLTSTEEIVNSLKTNSLSVPSSLLESLAELKSYKLIKKLSTMPLKNFNVESVVELIKSANLD